MKERDKRYLPALRFKNLKDPFSSVVVPSFCAPVLASIRTTVANSTTERAVESSTTPIILPVTPTF